MRWLVGLLVALGSSSLPVWADGEAVAGKARMEVRLPAGVWVAEYRNTGYASSVEGSLARVAVDVLPLASRAPFRTPSEAAAPPHRNGVVDQEPEALARALTAGATLRYDAVSRILAWVSTHVRYRLDRAEPQDPHSVIERRSAYCTGFARLTVALLEAVGIEAREVPGLVVAEGGALRFHRWVEIYYPDRGWVFSDPLRSHHYVPATYLPLASERLRHPNPRELRAEILGERGALWVVDSFPGVARGVRGRKNDDTQRVGVLRIQVEAPTSTAVAAVLEGDGIQRRLAMESGAATFLDVEPGRYTLRLEGDGVDPRPQTVRLRQRTRSIVHVPSIRGKGR